MRLIILIRIFCYDNNIIIDLFNDHRNTNTNEDNMYVRELL